MALQGPSGDTFGCLRDDFLGLRGPFWEVRGTFFYFNLYQSLLISVILYQPLSIYINLYQSLSISINLRRHLWVPPEGLPITMSRYSSQ